MTRLARKKGGKGKQNQDWLENGCIGFCACKDQENPGQFFTCESLHNNGSAKVSVRTVTKWEQRPLNWQHILLGHPQSASADGPRQQSFLKELKASFHLKTGDISLLASRDRSGEKGKRNDENAEGDMTKYSGVKRRNSSTAESREASYWAMWGV